MRNVELQRMLDNLIESLKSACEKNDVKTVKNVIASLESYTAIFTDANIVDGLTDALIIASKKNNKKLVIVLSEAIANAKQADGRETADINLDFEKNLDDVSENDDVDISLDAVLKYAGKTIDAAAKAVVAEDEGERDEAKDELKESAEAIGKTFKGIFNKAKEVAQNTFTKENLQSAGETVKGVTIIAVNKVKDGVDVIKEELKKLEEEAAQNEEEESEPKESDRIIIIGHEDFKDHPVFEELSSKIDETIKEFFGDEDVDPKEIIFDKEKVKKFTEMMDKVVQDTLKDSPFKMTMGAFMGGKRVFDHSCESESTETAAPDSDEEKVEEPVPEEKSKEEGEAKPEEETPKEEAVPTEPVPEEKPKKERKTKSKKETPKEEAVPTEPVAEEKKPKERKSSKAKPKAKEPETTATEETTSSAANDAAEQ